MDEKKLQAFIQWLPTKFEEFQNKTPDEIAKSLNDLYNKGEKGKATLQNMWKTFEQEFSGGEPGMFKEGGKLDFLVQKYAKGGKSTRKCTCGCELIMKKAKGGVIEECACGCKIVKEKSKQVESYQDGSKLQSTTNFQRWRESRWNGFPNFQPEIVSDKKGPAKISSTINKKGTVHNNLYRPDTGQLTIQSISNFGTPKADTSYMYQKNGFSRIGMNNSPENKKRLSIIFDQLFNNK